MSAASVTVKHSLMTKPAKDLALHSVLQQTSLLAPTRLFLTDDVYPAFEPSIMQSLSELGAFLMQAENAQLEPSADIIASGFWLRQANLQQIQAIYQKQALLGRGLTFHIAPANVDTLFFYSAIVSVLCGNPVVIRISRQQSKITQRLLTLLNQYMEMESTALLASRWQIIHYSHESEQGQAITRALTQRAARRLLWGSDQSIKAIQAIDSFSKQMRCSDITFPDRYSFAVLTVSDMDDLTDLARRLLQDIKPYQQRACASPECIFWLNTPVDIQQKFWQQLRDVAAEQLTLSDRERMEQRIAGQILAVAHHSVLGLIESESGVQRISVNEYTKALSDDFPGFATLFEYSLDDITELPVFAHAQTAVVYGLSETAMSWLTEQTPVRRLALPGTALTFSVVWDGIDLISEQTTACSN